MSKENTFFSANGMYYKLHKLFSLSDGNLNML